MTEKLQSQAAEAEGKQATTAAQPERAEAFLAWSIMETGLPTTSERPTTVTRAPSSGTS